MLGRLRSLWRRRPWWRTRHLKVNRKLVEAYDRLIADRNPCLRWREMRMASLHRAGLRLDRIWFGQKPFVQT